MVFSDQEEKFNIFKNLSGAEPQTMGTMLCRRKYPRNKGKEVVMEITAGMLILSEDKIVFYLLFKAEPCGMVPLFRVQNILITVCN